MKTFCDAIEAAEKVSKKDAKFAALAGIPEGSQQRLIVEALNPYRVFNVKKWDEPRSYAKNDPDGFGRFLDLLDDLHDRTVTGDAAREAVTDTLGQFTKRTAEYLARVIRKDLDCGAQDTTFRKVYPKLKIPSFDIMLAAKMDDESYEWKFPCLAEVKYDGERMIAFADGKDVTCFSRAGRPSKFAFFDDELNEMARNVGYPVVFDGEVLGNSFQETAQAKGEKNTEQKKGLRYFVFDMIPEKLWKEKAHTKNQMVRTGELWFQLEKRKKKSENRVMRAASKIVRSRDEARLYYEEMVRLGCEGLILKDINAPYVWDRDSAWTKMKPVYSVDLTVIEVLKGEGKYSNTCGALLLKGKDENGRRIETKMGSGLSDEDRDFFWKNSTRVLGKTVEIEYQEMTKAKNSDMIWALRFPVFIRIRKDK